MATKIKPSRIPFLKFASAAARIQAQVKDVKKRIPHAQYTRVRIADLQAILGPVKNSK